MSASDPNSAIYVTDSAKVIKDKVGPEKDTLLSLSQTEKCTTCTHMKFPTNTLQQ